MARPPLTRDYGLIRHRIFCQHTLLCMYNILQATFHFAVLLRLVFRFASEVSQGCRRSLRRAGDLGT